MPAQLVCPDRDERHGRRCPEIPDQEGEQIAGGLIGPLEVFDHEDHRCGPGEPLDDAEHQFEEPGLAIPVELGIIGDVLGPFGELREQAGELQTVGSEDRREPSPLDGPDESAKTLDEGCIRDATATELKARAGHDMSAALRCRRREALDEPRLADAGLATDDDRPPDAVSGRGQRVVEASELCGTPDEPPGLPRPGHRRRMIRGGVTRASLRRVAGQMLPAPTILSRTFVRALQSRVRVAPSDRPSVRAIS